MQVENVARMLCVDYNEGSFELHINSFRPTKEVYIIEPNLKYLNDEILMQLILFVCFRVDHSYLADTVSLVRYMCHGILMSTILNQKLVYDRHQITLTIQVTSTLWL